MRREPKDAEPSPAGNQGGGPARGGEGGAANALEDDVGALHAIVEGTARGTGEDFFRSLVSHLASAIDVPYAVVAEFAGVTTRVRTLAFWARDRIGAAF